MRFRLADKYSLAIAALILAVVYVARFGPYGFCDTDQGFIQALAWRVWNGQTPYLDFIYVRPPLSIYLHSLFVGLPRAVWLERLLFYLMMAFSVYFSTRSLQAFFDFRAVGVSPLLFVIMAFVCSVHNYPPMPWHTVDGIFFASMGIYLLCKTPRSFYFAFAGLLAMLLAALCKQAFYPMLFAGPLLLHLLFPGRRSNWAISLFAASLLLLLVAVWLFAPPFFYAFFRQTTGVTSLADVWQAGVVKYAKPLLLLVLPLLLIWWVQNLYNFGGFLKYLPVIVFWLFFFGGFGLHIHRALTTQSFVPPSFGFSQAMFLLALGVALRARWLHSQGSLLLLAMLAVAWCAGISWGYATPMLYFSPILFGFFYGLKEEMEFRVPRYFYGLVCFLLIWTFAILYQYPYREEARDHITYPLAEVFPRMAGIYGGEFIFRKSQTLASLHRTHGHAYTVLPAYPLAHYLTNSIPPIPIDWAHNAEMDYARNRDWMLRELHTHTRVVFIEKDKLSQLADTSGYGSALALYVRTQWQLIEENEYFEVYKQAATE